MTIQEATKIAEDYCSKRSKYRKARYGGIFDNGYLFSLDFQGSGHHGHPIFIIIRRSGFIKELECGSENFYKAWDSSHAYLVKNKASI